MSTLQLNVQSNTVTLRNRPSSVSIKLNAASKTMSLRKQITNVQLKQIGQRGLPGTSGDKNYIQNFNVGSLVVVPHNLNKYPSVTVIDSAGDEVEGDVDHDSMNQLTVRFSAAFSGKVICN